MTGRRSRTEQDRLDPNQLRSALHEWPAPAAPPAIEARLRRTFRSRLGRPRGVRWLPLAASVVLAVSALTLLLLVEPRGPHDARSAPRAEASTGPERASVSQPSPPPSSLTPLAGDSRRANRRPGRPLSPRPPAVPWPAAAGLPQIVVEPGQAELLVAFGSRLRDIHQAPAGASPAYLEHVAFDHWPDVPLTVTVAEIPRVHGRWGPVSGEWPLMTRPIPDEVVR